MNHILACVDASSYSETVCRLTAWAAGRLDANVALLHVVRHIDAIAARHDHSGAIGPDVNRELMEELAKLEGDDARRAVEAGRRILDDAAARLRDGGVTDLTLVHRHGDIVENVVEHPADLIVIGKRGVTSESAEDHIGSRVEGVVRASAKPVLVAPHAVEELRTAVIAYDASASADRALEFVASSPLLTGMDVHLVMAGGDSAAHRDQLDRAKTRLAAAGKTCNALLASGRAETVIGEHMAAHPNALLVMGAYGHSPLRNLIVGSTTTAMLRTVHAPVLLFR